MQRGELFFYIRIMDTNTLFIGVVAGASTPMLLIPILYPIILTEEENFIPCWLFVRILS